MFWSVKFSRVDRNPIGFRFIFVFFLLLVWLNALNTMSEYADEDSRTVFCGNISDKVTEALLYELFLQVSLSHQTL